MSKNVKVLNVNFETEIEYVVTKFLSVDWWMLRVTVTLKIKYPDK